MPEMTTQPLLEKTERPPAHRATAMRGVRGAVQARENMPEAILQATRELLLAIASANPTLAQADIASIFFTATSELNTVHPALAARELGWVNVPLLCAQEIPVPGGLPRVVRVLLHWNTPLSQDEIQHVYLGAAASLRPDLVTGEHPLETSTL